MVNILKERLPSNIAYQIMSYVGPHPVAAIMQEYNRFMELNIFPKRFYWGEWNTLYGYLKRESWTQKHYLTCLTYRDEGGVVYILYAWFIWHRFRDQGNKFIYRPIPTNMELMYRNLELCIEEVKMVELPYFRDSLRRTVQKTLMDLAIQML